MLTDYEKAEPTDRPRPDSVQGGTDAFSTYLDFRLNTDRADVVVADCVVVTVDSQGRLAAAASDLDDSNSGILSGIVDRGIVSGELGSTWMIPLADKRPSKAVLLVGTGDGRALGDNDFRDLASAVYAALKSTRVCDVALYLTDIEVSGRDEYWKIRQQIIALEEAAYRYRPSGPAGSAHSLRAVSIAHGDRSSAATTDGQAMAIAINMARMLGDTPPNICTPAFLADYALEMADQRTSITAEISNEQAMHELGMGALLSVGNASDQDSRLVVLNYRGGEKSQRPYVLIGKGITFDTGGTALKSRQSMRLMKYDMCGAAVILAALQGAAMLDLPINVVAIAACAENMPGSKATRPSDTVTSMSGKTVEILNPDAEGRLVLCDALTYAERFDPEVVIDVATLTGASLTALGRHYSALFTRDEVLSTELAAAGEAAMDKVWRLPLSEEDLSQLDSEFADIANMGDGTAGCVVAALFLAQFSAAFRWAHLDVSGTAKSHGDVIGATGRPVALLLQYLITQARAGQSK